MGIVPAGNEGAMSWTYRGKWIYPDAGGFRVSGTTIGRKLSPEHERLFARVRAEQLRRIEERRKRRE